MPFDLVGFGVATLDVIAEVSRFPTSGGKAKILSRELHGGGLTATALIAASKLGASCWYGGALGDNETSRHVRFFLEKYGVKTPVKTRYPADAEPFHSSVYLEPSTGERTILWSEFLTPPPIINEEAMKTALTAKCLFVDSFFPETLLPLYHKIRARGIPMVGDFEYLNSSAEEKVMQLVDHLVLPSAFAKEYTGCDAISNAVMKLLHQHDRAAAIVTDGKNGAWYAEKGDNSVRHQPIFPVVVCDTTGCGDVFHGAYAAALIFKMPIEERVRFAAAAAALKATKKGGQISAPTRGELDDFLSGESSSPHPKIN